MAERLIKKYPNRRLYDTDQSKYITLSDLKGLIVQGEGIKVIDSNSSEDITRAILMQIILETEAGGEPLFSASMLGQIIRFYGGALQNPFSRYLEESLNLFTRQNEAFLNSLSSNPMEGLARMTEENLKIWEQMQAQFLKASGFSGSAKDKGDA
ncbi:MAG: polyhydroxyalkanoate synthesis repressor PhaR [Gammaproteobacteria bacterium SHHR-1]|uniref:polyhydroxyalkanoate synthesis repressor PhaR n=1 Tax=Magnetovirga frankeli TaxID=947516 RepID=UPI0012939E6F|nr:polyhydroxyalkanoate synthesis repressor PhaR [gamma proteobacterium SS-5]